MTRLLLVWLALLAVAAAAGCGGSPDGAVATADPARTFAPLVILDEREPYMPMSADWFLDRAQLLFAEGPGRCADRRIAVGRKLVEQRTEVVNWIFRTGIGSGPAYWREAEDRRCEPRHGRYYANQLTRPYDVDVERAEGLLPGEGYVLDLMDWARRGPEPRPGRAGAPARVAIPAYVERRSEVVGGGPGLRLTYHLLFGMSDASDRKPAAADATHEGDWERIDVLLRDHDGEYEPFAVVLGDRRVAPTIVPWGRIAKRAVVSESSTHPVVAARRGDHDLLALPAGERLSGCAACPRWPLWTDLRSVAAQDWYGFGGAWGEAGRTDATTGSLGPYRDWAAGNPADDIRRSERRRPSG